jgi:hypothetical protein
VIRFYIMPIVRLTNPVGAVSRVPKYDLPAGVNWQGMDYGITDVYFFAADVTAEQHTALAANADVFAFAADLSQNLSGRRSTLSDALEPYGLPGTWLTASTTERAACRTIIGSCLIAQRYAGLARAMGADPALFPSGVTLNSTFASLPGAYRTRLEAAVDSQGYSRANLNEQSQLRNLLQEVGAQIPPITFLGVQV